MNEPQAVVVTGVYGVGKTTVVEERNLLRSFTSLDLWRYTHCFGA
jgi:adenylate kinase